MLLIGIVDILLDGVAQGCGQTGFALERFLSSSVRGSKGFSQLDRPRISLCDEKNFHSQFEAKLTFLQKF